MGRGRSGAGAGAGGGGSQFQDFPEAFAPGKDFVAVGGVDHIARTVSRTTQSEWDTFSGPMSTGITAQDEQNIMRQFTPNSPNARGAIVGGYVRTQNSFAINEILYDPANDNKSINKMFKRKVDRDTVKSLDKAINSNTTKADASYTRFGSATSIQATFGLTNQQMAMIAQAPNMNKQQLAALNRSLRGSKSFNPAYTSTSANRTLNAFNNPNAPQSRGFIFERKINVPKGTKAFAPRRNAQESETIFGRRMQTKLMGISVSADGHIVLHEMHDGYRP